MQKLCNAQPTFYDINIDSFYESFEITSLLHAKDDDAVVLAHLRLPQILAGEGGGGGEAEPPRPPLGIEHEPRVELHSVRPVTGLGSLKNDPTVAGSEIESGNSIHIRSAKKVAGE